MKDYKGNISTKSRKVTGKIMDMTVDIHGKISNTTLRGYSAYDIAVLNGFEGSQEEWLISLKGEDGFFTDVEIVSNTDDEYILRFITRDSSFITPNLRVTKNNINTNYTILKNKPSIESVQLLGNKTFSDLGIQPIEANDLLEILN